MNTHTARIKVGRKYFAVVDAADYDLVQNYNWSPRKHKSGTTYAAANVKSGDGFKTTLLLHRLVMGAKEGDVVDHIDHAGLNCTRANLRICSTAQNCRNRLRNKNNTSGYKGVTFFRAKQIPRPWKATIMRDGRTYQLGYYGTAAEAALAYDRAALALHGVYALLNFPGQLTDHRAANAVHLYQGVDAPTPVIDLYEEAHWGKRRSRSNTSGVPGVVRVTGRRKPWRASRHVEGKRVDVGYYATVEEARDALEAYGRPMPVEAEALAA